MKTEILLFLILAALLLVPIAMAEEAVNGPAPTAGAHEVLQGSGHKLAGLMLAKRSTRKPADKDRGFRDTDPVPGNPHPDGKGKIVSGIVISSVGGGIGVGLITYSIFNYCGFQTVDADGNYDQAAEDDCKKTNQILLVGGLASTALGLGIGLPRMFEGMKERRVWKQWNRDNAKRKRKAEYRTVYQYRFFLAPYAGSQAMALGFRFNY
jgi:hypothetical protein